MVMVRMSVGQFMPITFIALRLLIAGLGSLIVYAFIKDTYPIPINKKVWGHATVLGILGTAIPLASVAISLQYLSSGITSILLTLTPAITVILAHLFTKDEKLSATKSAGILLAFGGTTFLALMNETGLPDQKAVNHLGFFLVLIACISTSSSTVYARRFMQGLGTFNVNSIRIIMAATVMIPISVIFEGFSLENVNHTGLFGLFYSSVIGTFFAYFIGFSNIKHFGATNSAMVSYILPIVAGITGWLFLDEQITLEMLAGGIMIVSGIIIINRRAGRVKRDYEDDFSSD